MKKILVVEDDPKNMYLITFILKKNGYEAIEAWNGQEGIRRAAEDKPDLIIMDIKLPDMDGLEVTRRLREAGVAAPIVAVTSYALPGDKEMALKAGCAGYIEKPIDPEKIMAEIESFL